MKIGEIIEALKQGKQLAEIGKELMVGKEKLSKALKEAGYTFSRRTGWTFTGTGEEPLNKDYTDFVKSSRTVIKQPVTHASKEVAATTEKVAASNKQLTNVRTKEQTNVGSKVGLNEQTKELTKERINVVRKRSSFDIDVELMKDLKIQAVIHGKNVYEIVENAIRKELAELKRGN